MEKWVRTRLETLSRTTGLEWRRLENAWHALVHSSWANEHPEEGPCSNERLEFVGDAVLGLIVGQRIFLDRPAWNEGRMSRTRSKIVCESSLADAARGMGLGALLLLGRGEEATNGRDRASILADATEAVIGSLYLDSGLAACERFVMKILAQAYAAALEDTREADWKTMLQERLQRNGSIGIEYRIVSSEGPAHDRVFHMEVAAAGRVLGTGTGKSKKEAEQAAARQALEAEEFGCGGT